MRERIVFGIMVSVLLFLFAFVFLVLGKGEYVPQSSIEDTGAPTALVATTAPA